MGFGGRSRQRSATLSLKSAVSPMLKKFPRRCANPLPQSLGASRRDQPTIPLHMAQIYQTEGIIHTLKKCKKLLTIRFKLKNLNLKSVTFLALYTFVKKAFMSAKTFVRISN